MAIIVHQSLIDQLTAQRDNLRANAAAQEVQIAQFQQNATTQAQQADDLDVVLLELQAETQ